MDHRGDRNQYQEGLRQDKERSRAGGLGDNNYQISEGVDLRKFIKVTLLFGTIWAIIALLSAANIEVILGGYLFGAIIAFFYRHILVIIGVFYIFFAAIVVTQLGISIYTIPLIAIGIILLFVLNRFY